MGGSYFFATDTLGWPRWPFRWLLLRNELVFGQRWRLGGWTYSTELDALWAGTDDHYTVASPATVSDWIMRHG